MGGESLFGFESTKVMRFQVIDPLIAFELAGNCSF